MTMCAVTRMDAGANTRHRARGCGQCGRKSMKRWPACTKWLPRGLAVAGSPAGFLELARLARLARPLSGHHDAVHQTALAFGIVGVGLVHGAAVVPDHDVALAPDMAVLEARLDRVGDQLVEQGVALAAVQADHLLHAVGVEVERL